MNIHCAFAMLLSTILLTKVADVDANMIVLLRKPEYLDAMTSFELAQGGFVPIQQAPVYGYECFNRTCELRRFRTVRRGPDPIVLYRNSWVVAKSNGGDAKVIKCPKNTLGMGIDCNQKDCGTLRMLCGPVAEGFTINKTKKRFVGGSLTGKPVVCPDGMYMDGMMCRDWKCLYPGLYCVQLLATRTVSTKFPLRINGNTQEKSPTFSDSGSGESKDMMSPVFGIVCGPERECGNLQIQSITRGTSSMVKYKKVWTKYIGLAGQSVGCPPSMIVRQMRCKGINCSQISLACSQLSRGVEMDSSNIRTSLPFGEWPHSLAGTCPDGYYVTKVHCQHDRCAEMVLECALLLIIQ